MFAIIKLYAKTQGVPTLLVNGRHALQINCIDQFIHVDFNHFDPDEIPE
ncbi:hypothetical protein [Sporolactobacillus pectinivorans]|nr:hypothetical protein [Sporolactobacillus pectinivorans]